MVDTDQILELATRLASQIHEESGDRDGFVRQTLIAVEIDLGNSTSIVWASADDRPWAQIAFLDETARRMEMRRSLIENAQMAGDDGE